MVQCCSRCTLFYGSMHENQFKHRQFQYVICLPKNLQKQYIEFFSSYILWNYWNKNSFLLSLIDSTIPKHGVHTLCNHEEPIQTDRKLLCHATYSVHVSSFHHINLAKSQNDLTLLVWSIILLQCRVDHFAAIKLFQILYSTIRRVPQPIALSTSVNSVPNWLVS